MKAKGDMAGMIGWHTRNLHYQKKLPDLAKYLTPKKPKTAESGARDVKRMFDRMIAKQGDA
ncbi:hypothetical protein [Qipengyuania huizhouensis]|uniref:hypothetical protein n=1 Tax=Qipengyuania huizhouensis TaxID=2867245 RepID=UPI001C887632|nr:hypothetical protein [Qipengyuania huizhouensis]MBX7459558.1 hypothetical protein [Qipengyuania huizhouensis]